MYQELFNHMYNNHELTLLESELSDIVAICRKIPTWTYTIDKEPPLEAEIIFCTKSNHIFAGYRTHLTQGNKTRNHSVYIDFRKNKIRNNIIKWKPIE